MAPRKNPARSKPKTQPRSKSRKPSKKAQPSLLDRLKAVKNHPALQV